LELHNNIFHVRNMSNIKFICVCAKQTASTSFSSQNCRSWSGFRYVYTTHLSV